MGLRVNGLSRKSRASHAGWPSGMMMAPAAIEQPLDRGPIRPFRSAQTAPARSATPSSPGMQGPPRLASQTTRLCRHAARAARARATGVRSARARAMGVCPAPTPPGFVCGPAAGRPPDRGRPAPAGPGPTRRHDGILVTAGRRNWTPAAPAFPLLCWFGVSVCTSVCTSFTCEPRTVLYAIPSLGHQHGKAGWQRAALSSFHMHPDRSGRRAVQ